LRMVVGCLRADEKQQRGTEGRILHRWDPPLIFLTVLGILTKANGDPH